ncbi:MAG: MmgE/PrpD family protein [Balneolaceae bacterium]|nr:MmgE/PrpD family protein [Balneolaceae bacterium]
MESISRQLYRLLQNKPVSKDALKDTRLFMLDWAGCFAGGKATHQGEILSTYHTKWAGEGLLQSVFLMAAQSHITETDDLHRGSVTHPACVVFPVAWQLSLFLKKNLHDCLIASLQGYEVMCRVGEAVGPGHYKIFHNTATAGVYGAAAAASVLLQLSEDQFVWAMGNAGTQAAGLWQFNEDASMSKHLHAGHAAEAGLKAALMAAENFTGTEKIFEGEKGFFTAFCSDPAPLAVTKPSDGWKLSETSIKPYPSCRHTHPAIDAALQIRGQMKSAGVQPESVEAIEIVTYETALRFTDNPGPESTFAAKFSIQYCVCLALEKGFPMLPHFEGDELRENRSSILISKTLVRSEERFNKSYPKNWGAHVLVKTAGSTFEAEIESAKGDPENPLSNEEMLKKYAGLMAYAGIKKSISEDLSIWILEADDSTLIPELNIK